MKKSFIQSIVSAILLLFFVAAQIIIPLQAEAGPALNWSNPNTGSPYKVKVSDILSPQLLTSVVGCTGVIDKMAKIANDGIAAVQKAAQKLLASLAKSVLSLFASKAKRTAIEAGKQATREGILDTLAITATAAGTSVFGTTTGGATTIGSLVNIGVDSTKNIQTLKVTDTDLLQKLKDTTDAQMAAIEASQEQVQKEMLRDNCINGIAIQLAKNQLTAMTRDTLSWVSKGFGGDPLFVRNADAFMDSISRSLIQKESDYFTKQENQQLFPYGRYLASNEINGYKSSQNTYDALQSDLQNFLPSGVTPESFSKDFSQGGWNGWLALTQHPQDNLLGFTQAGTQAIANKINNAINNTQQELVQNGGYISQKRCIAWNSTVGPTNGMTKPVELAHTDANCSQYETVTPGSTIKDKVATNINTPERQLEMVKTLNDALNALFSALLSQFEKQGLSSLGSQPNPNIDLTGISGGQGSNTLFDANGNPIPTPGGSAGGDNGAFNLLTDLGDTYIEPVSDGTWNASTNSPSLIAGIGVANHYYTVSTAGATDIGGAVNYWKVGDKAYYNGTTWEKGVPGYIIAKNGALQDQQDFIDRTNKSLGLLPQILPAVGKLDACIPGPNPNWEDGAVTAEQSLVDNGTTTEESNYWSLVAGSLNDEYSKKIDALYGPSSPMMTPGNSAYLKMAQSGLDITKDISTDKTNIDQSTSDYTTSINQATSDLAALDAIKTKVNQIIEAAQTRRTALRKKNGLEAFKQSCLDAEKVSYIVNGVRKY